MKSKELFFISVEPRDGQFRAFMTIDGLLATENDPEFVLHKASELYGQTVRDMHSLIGDMQKLRSHRKPIPARMMWMVGDSIFRLKNALGTFSFQLNDIYGHLTRDLDVKRKWLEKAIIFRRYLPKGDLIPESLNWGKCEKGTRRVAEKLRQGLPLA